MVNAYFRMFEESVKAILKKDCINSLVDTLASHCSLSLKSADRTNMKQQLPESMNTSLNIWWARETGVHAAS